MEIKNREYSRFFICSDNLKSFTVAVLNKLSCQRPKLIQKLKANHNTGSERTQALWRKRVFRYARKYIRLS